ncbi:MAG TPA: hypothetical protein VK794_04795 [Steroidobacteraceae bacterium]|jgi:hypothetical protein|nr:hypothetical protein [Steroidobacteraceae bacterium]
MDGVQVPALPAMLSSMACVFVLARESTDEEKLEITLSAGMVGGEFQKFPVTVDFQGKLLARALVAIAGIVLMQVGVFRAMISLRDSTDALGTWDIPITLLSSAPSVQIRVPAAN